MVGSRSFRREPGPHREARIACPPPRIRRAGATLLAWILLSTLAGCPGDSDWERSSAESMADVVIVSFDTLRADHTSLGGTGRRTTPNLLRAASEGVEFTRAYAPSATTGPSHASLFTGLYPAWHGVTKNGVPLVGEHPTLAERFRREGYATAGFVSSFVLDRQFGFGRGFDVYDDRFGPGEGTLEVDDWEGFELDGAFDRRGVSTMDSALAWLAPAMSDPRPFFLFVHLFDPHAPYVPPPRLAGTFGFDERSDADLDERIRRYDAEIAFADEQLGRLLALLDDDDFDRRTLLLVVADHGEGLMDHGVMEHGAQLYDSMVRVPIVLRMPGGERSARRLDAPIGLVDLTETIWSLSTRRPPETFEGPGAGHGRDRSGWILGLETATGRDPVFFHRRPYRRQRIDDIEVFGERYGVREGRWKYLSPGDGEPAALYDVEQDPGETRDRSTDAPAVARRLAEAVDVWRAAFPDRVVEPIPSGVRSRLEAIGYVE